MSSKPSARFTFLLDPDLKTRFEELCAAHDITPSQQMRQMIKAHLSGQPPAPARAAPPKPGVRRVAKR
jgi:predicted transcriptional regulator